MSYVDAKFIEPFIDNNFSEKYGLREFFKTVEKPSIENQKEYVPKLLEEFTKRINNDDILLYYGWTENDVTRAIADNIEPEELKDHANEIAKRWRLKEFVLDGIGRG